MLAGTLDALAATLSYYIKTGNDPLIVYRFIASGVFGTDAFSWGVPMALLGIVFHYIIALGWTVLFFVVADRLSHLIRYWYISGILYGIFIWLMMNLVIVPLSLVPMKEDPKEWTEILKGALILIVCVGLPIAYSARKYLKGKS